MRNHQNPYTKTFKGYVIISRGFPKLYGFIKRPYLVSPTYFGIYVISMVRFTSQFSTKFINRILIIFLMVGPKKIKTEKKGKGENPDKLATHNISLKTGKLQIKREKNQLEDTPSNPKVYNDRIKTGIEGLDRVMGGGFEKDSINIICGGPGTGKSIFALQFLVNGIEKFDEHGVYITFEESKNKIIKHMASLGLDLKKLEDSNKLAIVEYTPEHVKKLLTEGGGEVDLVVEKIHASRIVIDSLTAFALLFKDDLARMEAFLDLFKLMQKWGCTALLISEDEQNVKHHHPNNVEFEADGIILLYNIRKGDLRKRAIEILKMRGISHSNKIFPIKITNKGIVVFPDENVF